MKLSTKGIFNIFYSLIFFVLLFTSCTVDRLESQEVVYENDFSTLDLNGIVNAKLFVFHGDTLLGFFNNEETTLTINDLPGHNVVKIEVEILIHDSWDGNVNDGFNGPDFWYMKVDDKEIFRTTFSNSPCESTFCLRQSYPHNFMRQNFPKEGAIQTNLPGLCIFGAFQNYTTRYMVVQLISHTDRNVSITFGDELFQFENPNPVCDESWSINKIKVTTMVVI
ncbi:hypothetical protein [Mongoliitalea lutea]|uniref:Lipoprotein n=1 Tax=Mongoliitalea lutea TaxID=849756 RepID=A0A8J3CYS7_9BACT|nr:hypothetical protein [Mongoliitalea lutea]GHB46024.1 hypothetical protein GCM10008106_28710 [Mongoliitalea lutea]